MSEQIQKKPGVGGGNETDDLEIQDLSDQVPEADDVLAKLEAIQQEEVELGALDFGCGCL